MCQSRYTGLDSLYCGKWGKISKSHRDLDLDRTMPNVELVRAIFKYYNMFKLSCTQTQRHTDGKTPRRKDEKTDRQIFTVVSSPG